MAYAKAQTSYCSTKPYCRPSLLQFLRSSLVAPACSSIPLFAGGQVNKLHCSEMSGKLTFRNQVGEHTVCITQCVRRRNQRRRFMIHALVALPPAPDLLLCAKHLF